MKLINLAQFERLESALADPIWCSGRNPKLDSMTLTVGVDLLSRRPMILQVSPPPDRRTVSRNKKESLVWLIVGNKCKTKLKLKDGGLRVWRRCLECNRGGEFFEVVPSNLEHQAGVHGLSAVNEVRSKGR